MKPLVLFGLLMSSLTLSAQSQNIAVIKGEFANILWEKSDSADVICQVSPEDFFSIKSDDGEWAEVLKPTYSRQVEGYLRSSQCRLVKGMSKPEKREIIKSTFDKELELVLTENYEEKKAHHEPRFGFILDFASNFILETKDDELLSTFIKTVKFDDSSVDEAPDYWLGWIYWKSPDWSVSIIKKVGTDESLISDLEFGFENAVPVKEQLTPKYEELRSRLSALRQ